MKFIDDPIINRLRLAGFDRRRELIAALAARAAAVAHADPYLAIAGWQEARDLVESLDGRSQEWRGYTRQIANQRERLHDLEGAAAALAEAKPPDGSPADELYGWANSRAMLAERLGEWHLATALYDVVVREFGKLTQYGRNSLFGLSNAAVWACDSGDSDKAERILFQFKEAVRRTPDSAVTYEISMVEARIAAADRDLPRANAAWLDVAATAQRTGQPELLPSIAEIRCGILHEMGMTAEAVALLRPLVATEDGDAAGGYPVHQMAAAVALGELLAEMADEAALAEARDVLTRALAGEITRGMPEAEWRILAALAEVSAARNAAASAILFGKLAVEVIARLEHASPSRPESAVRELELRTRPHMRLNERLVEAGRFPEAAQAQDMIKGETAVELAGRSDHLHAKVLPWRIDEARIADDYRDVAARARQANSRAQAGGDDQAGAAAAEAAQARRYVVRWANRLLDGAEERDLAADTPRDFAVPELPDTLALHFLPAGGGWEVQATVGRDQFNYRVDGDAATIARRIFDLRSAIVGQDTNWKAGSNELFERLMRPADAMLRQVLRVAISSEGVLGYLPFAALHDGERCLVERAAIWKATGLAPRRRRERDDREWRALLFGHEGEGLDRIAFVGVELDAIHERLEKARRVTPFTEENFAEALSGGADIVHVASHFRFVPARPGRSYLALEDGALTLDRFRSKRFPLTGTSLLVLSACDTGVEDYGPFGVESFAGLAQAKGAQQIIGTLWRVNDVSAAAFMTSFYGRLGNAPREPFAVAAAVRQAQLDMISGAKPSQAAPTRGGLSLPRRSSWEHPYHWAGYTLYG